MSKPSRDAMLFAKAFASNQLARFAPATYMRLTAQTGRGEQAQPVDQIADYFRHCVDDYFQRLNVSHGDGWLHGKQILEYGPGDILGVALLMYAHGAAKVRCIDRFPLMQASDYNLAVYRELLASLDGDTRIRAEQAFREPGRPESGFRSDAIDYRVAANGLSGETDSYDVILSRSVLEHVNDLTGTLRDIATAIKPNGVSIHSVDLKSHGLDRDQAFDFLTWSDLLYKLMYSHKGFPNRWRVDKYRDCAKDAKLHIEQLSPTGQLKPEQIAAIQTRLPDRFRELSAEELGWLGFWMVLRPERS